MVVGSPPAVRRGVTLIEALIVLVVVAVLVAIALPRYHTMKERALTAALRADLLEVGRAQEGFFAEHRRYATSLSELGFTPTTAGAAIQISSNDPRAGWTASASAPFQPGSGTCFLSGGSEGTTSGGSGVQCSSYAFDASGKQQ